MGTPGSIVGPDVEVEAPRLELKTELVPSTGFILLLHQFARLRREMWSVPCFQPDRIPSTIGSLSCLAVTFTTQQINS